MNDRNLCGNENALIAFLYDEGDSAEREAMAAHMAHCPSCVAEIESLRVTRVRLAAWTPPAAALGFRMTGEESAPQTATVLTSPRWWARPLPAWAQAAAAVVIFAGGMAFGSARASTTVAESRVSPAPPAAAATVAVSREDFNALRSEVAALRNAPSDDARQLVSDSEARQRREWDRRIAELVTDFQAVRYADMQRVSNTMNGYQALTGQRLMEQNDTINRAISAGRVVPTSLVR